jgi:hypothetical protein
MQYCIIKFHRTGPSHDQVLPANIRLGTKCMAETAIVKGHVEVEELTAEVRVPLRS